MQVICRSGPMKDFFYILHISVLLYARIINLYFYVNSKSAPNDEPWNTARIFTIEHVHKDWKTPLKEEQNTNFKNQ